MKLTKLTIKDLFTKDKKLTFLVGAGCSYDKPSNLPLGREMLENIIKYTCAESEINNILKLGNLRFESLVGIFQDRLDRNLKIIDYYGLCDKPNLQHFFLAKMIKENQFVITTNFDFLIEYALLQSRVPKEAIIPVITKKDFEKFKDPYDLIKKKKKPLYKIHGSTKNIITNENTRSSLISTIEALGKNKAGLNIFQLEPHKREIFKNISEGRSLVVVGYSGSDDFDIIPTLKTLKNLKNLIWIYFKKDDDGKERIYEIDDNISKGVKRLSKVDQTLLNILRMGNIKKIYRVDANTTRIMNELLSIKPKLSKENFSMRPIDWFKKTIEIPNKFNFHHIPYSIYRDLDKYNDALRCAEKMLQIAEDLNDKNWIAIALNNIGTIYSKKGDNLKALNFFNRALQMREQLEYSSETLGIVNNIGYVYFALGNTSRALEQFENVLKKLKKIGNLRNIAVCLTNIGAVYKDQKFYDKALIKFKEVLQIEKRIGNLWGIANSLNHIGGIYKNQEKYPKALGIYEKALKIVEQLSDLSESTAIHNNIGNIFKKQKKYSLSLNKYKTALLLIKKTGKLLDKAFTLHNIGVLYQDQGKYVWALRYEQKAFQLFVQLKLSETVRGQIIKSNIRTLEKNIQN